MVGLSQRSRFRRPRPDKPRCGHHDRVQNRSIKLLPNTERAAIQRIVQGGNGRLERHRELFCRVAWQIFIIRHEGVKKVLHRRGVFFFALEEGKDPQYQLLVLQRP